MDYVQLSAEVETKALNASNVHMYMGSNVKSPGLVKGAHYIIKYWSVKSLSGGDNPFWIGQFVGAGDSPEQILPETPRAIKMEPSQRYFFKRPNGEYVAAGNFDGALAVNNDKEQRITFYGLLGEARQDALPLAAPTMRADKANPTEPARRPREHVLRATAPRVAREPKVLYVPQTVEQFMETMRILFDNKGERTHINFLVAQFLTAAEAAEFAKKFKECQYVLDGFAHTARAPEDLNDSTSFFAQAKEQGSVSKHIYRSEDH